MWVVGVGGSTVTPFYLAALYLPQLTSAFSSQPAWGHKSQPLVRQQRWRAHSLQNLGGWRFP